MIQSKDLGSTSAPSVQLPVVPLPELDGMFAPRREGYLGADAACSVQLDDRRVLWLFGDTLFGTMEGQQRRMAAMPRNSIAIQYRDGNGGRVGEFRFKGLAGRPVDYIQLPGVYPGEWFWIACAFMVAGRLFLVGRGVTHGTGPCEALAFRVLGDWLLEIPNPQDDPDEWEIRAGRLTPLGSPRLLGMAHYLDRQWLYLFAPEMKRGRRLRVRAALLCRVGVDDLLEGRAASALEFWAGEPGARSWSRDPHRATPLFEPASAEAAIHYDAPRGRFVATTYSTHTPDFFACTAPEITGPWSRPKVVFRASEHKPVGKLLSYTFRAHPHLSAAPDSLVLTYVVNAREPKYLFARPDIYYPRFVQLDLEAI